MGLDLAGDLRELVEYYGILLADLRSPHAPLTLLPLLEYPDVAFLYDLRELAPEFPKELREVVLLDNLPVARLDKSTLDPCHLDCALYDQIGAEAQLRLDRRARG